jgi:hypothetical protein
MEVMGSTRKLLALLAFVLGVAIVPHRVCEREANAWFEGEPDKVDALASQVAAWTSLDLAPESFQTGSGRFDGEWQFGTYMMAAMGFGQTMLGRPEQLEGAGRREALARMERCLDMMLAPHVHAFDTTAWNGEDALASLETDHGHAAYLGYTGLALGLHRVLEPASRFAKIDDAIVAALVRRIEASPIGFLETYPGEVYPVDNTAAYAAIALHARATRKAMPAAVARGLDAIRKQGTEASTGLLFQAVQLDDGRPRDAARASGTALAAYFLAYADDAASASLFRALGREQFRTVLGFGAMLEYAATPVSAKGRGDIDSGPIVAGFGVSATGFALGASRVHGDREMFRSLYATAHLFGAPFDEKGTRTHATGGPIGDAILFAMMTAPSKGRLSA